MQFIVENEKLSSALALVKGCVPARSTIPILAHIVVEAKPDNTITIRASNLDRETEVSVPAQVEKPGGAALPGEVLCGLAKRLSKGGQCEITLVDDRAKVVSGGSKFDLRTLPAEDFPVAKEMGTQPVVFSLPGSDVAKLISSVLYATDNKSSRSYHQGVNLRIEALKLIAVGTNDNRLAVQSVDIPKGSASMPAICVPVEAARLLVETVTGCEGDVELSVSPALLEMRLPGIRVASAIVDCKLPSYAHLIPKSAPLAIFRPYTLAEAVERASVVFLGQVDTNKRIPFVELSIKSSGIELKAGVRGDEQATETVEIESATGETSVRVNAQYLAECLAAWPESVSVGISQDGKQKPIMLSSEARPDTFHLLAPTMKDGA